MHTLETGHGYNLEDRRKKRKQLKTKRRLTWLKRFFLSVLLVTTLSGLAISPLFNLTTIEVNGSQHYTNEDIIGVITLSTGNNAFKSLIYEYMAFKKLVLFRFARSEESILQSFPYVKDAKVQYVVPGKVKISITEREPFAIITGPDVNLLVDRDGHVLESAKKIDTKGFITINGIRVQNVKPGQAVSPDIGASMRVLTRLLTAMEQSDSNDSYPIIPAIQAVNLEDVKNVRLFLDGRVAVNLGDIERLDNIEYRINFLKQIFFKSIGKKDVGTIDFTTGDKPRFIPEAR